MNYELICIFSPKITEKELETEINKISDLLQELGADKVESSNWGKKTLAYEIKGVADGYYVQYNFLCNPENVENLEKKLKLEGQIIRFLVTKQEIDSGKGKKDKKESRANKKEEKKYASSKKESTEEKQRKVKESNFDEKLEEALNRDIAV